MLKSTTVTASEIFCNLNWFFRFNFWQATWEPPLKFYKCSSSVRNRGRSRMLQSNLDVYVGVSLWSFETVSIFKGPSFASSCGRAHYTSVKSQRFLLPQLNQPKNWSSGNKSLRIFIEQLITQGPRRSTEEGWRRRANCLGQLSISADIRGKFTCRTWWVGHQMTAMNKN